MLIFIRFRNVLLSARRTVRKTDGYRLRFCLRRTAFSYGRLTKKGKEVDEMIWERRGFGGGRGRGGFGRSRMDRDDNEPKPVKEGEVQTVTISDISRRGDGIARVKNFVIFVPGTQKGDVVKIRIKEVRGNHATGEVISEGEEVEDHSDDVIEAEGGTKNNGGEGEAEESAPVEPSEEESEDEEEQFV
jgi:predicted RNA-binding protein with TRAM domain